MFVSFLEEESGAASKRAKANQLTALLMQPPASASTPLPGNANENKENTPGISVAMPNPLLITAKDARSMHATAFKTSLPLLPTYM